MTLKENNLLSMIANRILNDTASKTQIKYFYWKILTADLRPYFSERGSGYLQIPINKVQNKIRSLWQ